jgi:hypothetical protein
MKIEKFKVHEEIAGECRNAVLLSVILTFTFCNFDFAFCFK